MDAFLGSGQDLLAVRATFDAARPLNPDNAYLTGDRLLPPALLAADRFAGRARVDARGNILFPHWTLRGGEAELCGFEIKNAGFTGFARGGQRGLWGSGTTPNDHTLVIAESAIDALSYAALHGHEQARFVSTGGALGEQQVPLLIAAIHKLPHAGHIVCAVDNDAGGDQLIGQLDDVFAAAERPDHGLTEDRPSSRGSDWNDELRQPGDR